MKNEDADIGIFRSTAAADPTRVCSPHPSKNPIGLPNFGFSLIELIGVIAVIAILASMIFYATAKRIDVGVSTQEVANLQTYAVALQASIFRNRYIPGPNDWYSVIATELGINTNMVLFNMRNRTSPRIYMIDPNLTNSLAGGLPYTQGNAGAPYYPTNARVMIISSLFTNFSPAASSATNFNTLWGTTDGQLPSNGTFPGWSPDDLKIQRINLAPMFVNLQLANYFSSTNYGQYRIDTNVVATVGTNGVNAYFLQNTPLQLLTDTNSASTTNAELILARGGSYYYVAQVWRDVPFVPDPAASQTSPEAANLASVVSMSASMFLQSSNNINAASGTTPTTVLTAMTNFMAKYVPYAFYAVYTNGGGWTSGNNPYEPNALAAQTALGNALNNLAANITQGGCTNGP